VSETVSYYEDSKEIEKKIWDLLSKAVKDRSSEFRTPVFICGNDKDLDGRVVVLRKADQQNNFIQYHSDIRSSKIEKINLSNRLKFIDIGVPRNISNDVKQHKFVKSFDVDDLQEVVSRNLEFRQKLAKEAESLVEEERIIFLEWWASLEAVPVINKLRSDLELIRKEELQKALSRMGPDFSARERKVVEALTKGIINKILHTPVTKLRSPQSREERQVSLKIVEKLFS